LHGGIPRDRAFLDPPRTYYAFFYNKMKDKLKEMTNMTLPDCDRWSLYNSVFFSFTCMTTIGK
jgi:hypothetical protein